MTNTTASADTDPGYWCVSRWSPSGPPTDTPALARVANLGLLRPWPAQRRASEPRVRHSALQSYSAVWGGGRWTSLAAVDCPVTRREDDVEAAGEGRRGRQKQTA